MSITQVQGSQIALREKTESWIGKIWSSLLPRGAGLYWWRTAEETLKTVETSHQLKNLHLRQRDGIDYRSGKSHENKTNGLELRCMDLHKSMRGWAWGRDHDYKYSNLDHRMRANYISLFLAGNIAYNQNKLQDDQKLPAVDAKDSVWVDYLAHDSWPGNNFSGYPDEATTLESFVRWELENTWRTRQPKPLNWHDALNWHKTSIAALMAVYKNIDSLKEAENVNMFRKICYETHELMTKYKLWGSDTHKPDRFDKTGNMAKPFDALSPEMKENLVLIVLSTLSAISDYKSEINALFDISESGPELAPCDNYEIEPVEEDEGLVSPVQNLPLTIEATDPTTP